MQAVTRKLAEFAAGGQGSPEALQMMRLSLFDWAACGIAGRSEPVARVLRDMVQAEGGKPEATLIGGGRAPARAVALANGAASHALDYDDTHFAHIGHPSVAVIPAALAMAERTGATGPDLLAAALIGVEVSIRLGVWLGRDHYQAGFHQTGTAGAFGATAAAGRLLGLDAGRMEQALGLCATRASGLKSQFGTMGKPYNAGIAAANGVECALLAAAGMVSRPDGIEVAQGFGPTHHGMADNTALNGIGREWLFLSISHKFHACCHGTHAMLEALRGLPVAAAQVAEIRVETHPRWMTVCNIPEPSTGLEAKFSFSLIAAMSVSGLDTGALHTFSDDACDDPALVALRDRVTVVADPQIAETATRVTLTLTTGQTQIATHDLATPVPADLRAVKLREKARALLGEAEEDLWNACLAPDIAALTALLSRA